MAFLRVHPSDVKRPVDGILTLAVVPGTARMCGDDAQPSRPRGSSKFNEVERVDGREKQLTGNLFLPTELCGSSKDPETGQLCEVL